MSDLDRFYTVPEAARLLRCCDAHMRDLCARGKVRATKPAGSWLIDKAALEAQLEASRNCTGAEALDASLGR